tara:strand:+ start:872 stop:1729 length:858 start_codon:yes stop_codon:yes gene_type:complete
MIPYSKLNSQGNDFILVECDKSEQPLSIDQIVHFSQRHVIGCDQFFIIYTSDLENIRCDVYNQDGSKACQCGNGLRATMLYVNRKYSINKTNLIVCGIEYMAEINNDSISINMGSPKYINTLEKINKSRYSIVREGLVVTIHDKKVDIEFSFIPLSIGNNHCIVFSDNCSNYMEDISRIINEIFKGIMNIGFIKNYSEFMTNSTVTLDIIVNEKGSGYTDSCGSGATAAAICMFKLFELKYESKVSESRIRIRQKGGILEVVKSYNPDEFTLIGPSTYDGEGFLE